MTTSAHPALATPNQASPKPISLPAIHLMFFLSGAASLICQVVWFKQLQFILGSSTFAVSVTVASFFMGLSAGSWIGGSLADRVTKPLRLYAICEFAVSLICLAISYLISHWSTWAVAVTPVLGERTLFSATLTVAIAFSVLLIPTLLMGATLPMLVRFIVREQGTLAQRVGYLYAVNTLGAATGCLLVGLVLIGWIGVLQSAGVAAAVYFVIGCIATVLSFQHQSLPANSEAEYDTAAADTSARDRIGSLVLVFSLSGFTSIAYEVLWFRVLANFSLHTVYAFSGMLATYLIGLVVGSWICARYLAHRKDKLLTFFTELQLFIGLSGLVTLAMLGRSRNIISYLSDVPAKLGLGSLFIGPLANIVDVMLFCFVVLIVPTTLIGISFPLASELTINRLGGLGKKIGRLYALNTLGGTLGSLATGFLLLPLLGSQGSLTVIIALNFVLYGYLLYSQRELAERSQLIRNGVVAGAAACVAFVVLGPSYLQEAQTHFGDAEVLAFREAPDATFAVLQYHSNETGNYQQLVVNGRSYANNSPPGRRYMSALAHVPTLLHPNPSNALVVCIGTGTTVASLTTHPELKDIYAVDLSSEVFEFANHFEPINRGFHNNPRVHQIAADGRHFLLSRERTYDVITFEPPPPHDTGVVNLYSQEFYALAKKRLRHGGVVAQWIPMDLPRQMLPKMMIQSMLAEFKHVSLWIPNRMEGVVIGSQQPLSIDIENWRLRMAVPSVKEDLAVVGVDSAEHLAATFIVADSELARYIGNAPLVTDNHPRIEYHNFYKRGVLTYEEMLRYQEPLSKYLKGSADDETLAAAQLVVRNIWLEHEATAQGNFDDARELIEEALLQEPHNQYLTYLKAMNRAKQPSRMAAAR